MKIRFYPGYSWVILALVCIALACSKKDIAYPHIVLLDYDGQYVQAWKTQLEPVQVTKNQRDSILDQVRKDFAGFRITITDDPSLYNQADSGKRHMVCITQNVTFFIFPKTWGGATLGVGTYSQIPTLVFWDNIKNNTPPRLYGQRTGKVVTHELGHALGLYHYIDTLPSFAIMGASWDKPGSWWRQGINEHKRFQDDIEIINNKLK